ncbi:MAG: Rieske 2Fe-2S domain-containing protein, partial [Caulobacteraceae bacterium]|nr:Rieske 2Fe-2S domain-containing protein [Caulobacteraceae bacterium]
TAFLTDVSPGAPMHKLMKHYWLPVALSSDFPGPDSDPKRVRVLGEDYVGFRDSDGRLALLRELCCHRGASLCLGRVEEGGIRCIYHGWKFNAEGTVLDMPNCDDERFKTRYRQPAFAVQEKAGLVWAFLGPADEAPPLPRYPFFDAPEENVFVEAPAGNANFVQMIEGLVDSSHLGFLHADSLNRGSNRLDSPPGGARAGGSLFLENKTPRLEAEDTEYGMRYAALRELPGKDGATVTVARVTAFALPVLTFIAAEPGSGTCVMATPVDTGHTIFFHLFWRKDQSLRGSAQEQAMRDFLGLHPAAMKQFGLDRDYRDLPTSANRGNNWHQDRAAMKRGETFSGLVNFLPEDIAVMESMGAVYPREYEHLLNSDLGVARMRRTLIDNAERVQRGEAPVGVNSSEVPLGLQFEVAPGETWQDRFRKTAPAVPAAG